MQRVVKSMLLALVVLGLGANSAVAALIVYSGESAWKSVPSKEGATYVLPADLSGINCGVENETTCEPTGYWFFNQKWTGLPSYISMTEPGGGLSDIIMFDSLGPNGAFRVLFFSDPDLPKPSLYAGYIQYANYNEGPNGTVTGAIPVCCITAGPFLNVVMASDGEVTFDPFGAGFDTSDGMQFQGAIDGGTVPEPASLTLLGTGLVVAAWRSRRRRA